MQVYTIRLKPGEDILAEIESLVLRKKIEAGVVLACVGSLTEAVIRYANQETITHLLGRFEIVSLTGIVSLHGSHLHISISNEKGYTIGGHLSAGCRVYTTAEIAVLALDDVQFVREYCELSGYEELVVRQKHKNGV